MINNQIIKFGTATYKIDVGSDRKQDDALKMSVIGLLMSEIPSQFRVFSKNLLSAIPLKF